MARIRRVDSKKEQEKIVDEFMTRGYKVKSHTQYTAKVKEKDWGNLFVHIFIFILTFAAAALFFNTAGFSPAGVWGVVVLANVSYAVYSWYTAEEVIIKVED